MKDEPTEMHKPIAIVSCSQAKVQSVLETSNVQHQPRKSEMSGRTSMNPRKIAFYGLFGMQNWGNECTLQAVLYNVRRFLPSAELRCFCTDPDDTLRTHNIPAFPIASRYEKGYQRLGREKAHPLIRLFQKVFIQVPVELLSWARAFKCLRGFDMLVVPGTGLLTDFSTTWLGFPYHLLKWSIIAKLCRCELIFVSVGAGPMYHPLTKWFIRAALSLATYRSYRDSYSKQFLESVGFRADSDCLYPDLAFSLPRALFPEYNRHDRQKTVVGVGMKDYYGKLGLPQKGGEAKYRDFINKLGAFVTWLLQNGYAVRFLIGDTLCDYKVKQDVIELLRKRGIKSDDWDITAKSISSVTELLSELASTDIVVSPRFHNILLALMLGKPVASLSYHEKFSSLMAGFGLAAYCHDIDDLDVDLLTKHVTQLEKSTDGLKPQIKQKVEEYRDALDEQYTRIFTLK